MTLRLDDGRLLLHAGLLVWVLAIFIPWHQPPWTSFHTEVVAGIGLALVVAGAVWSRQALQMPGIGWLALALVPVALLQWLVGQLIFRGDAFLAVYYLLALALAALAGRTWRGRPGDPLGHGLALALLAAGAGSAALALAQAVAPDALRALNWRWILVPRGSQAFANLAQPNMAATVMVLGVLGLLWLYERRVLHTPLHHLLGLLLAVVLGLGIAATRSRTGLLELGVVLSWLVWSRGWINHRLPVTLAVGYVVVTWALAWNWPSVMAWWLASPGEVSATTAMVPRDHSQSAAREPRWIFWQYGLQAAAQSPWVGWGFGQIPVAQQTVAPELTPIGYLTQYWHALPLDLAAWLGVPLGLAVTVMLAWLGLRALRHVRKPTQAIWPAGLLAMGVHAMLEYPHAYVYTLLPAALMFGLCATTAREAPRWALSRPAVAGGWALSCVLGLVITTDYLAVQATPVGRAGGTSFQGDFGPPPAVYLLDHLLATRQIVGAPAPMQPDAAHVALAEAVSRRRPSAPTLLHQAQVQARIGHPHRAEAALAVLCKLESAPTCRESLQRWADWAEKEPALQRVAVPSLPPS